MNTPESRKSVSVMALELYSCHLDKYFDRNQPARFRPELCESPIEELMMAALQFCEFGYFRGPHPVEKISFDDAKDVAFNMHHSMAKVMICPQYPVGAYRLDFAVFVMGFDHSIARLAVECDGHDFHEKTKQQAAKDKKRDRDLMLAGWRVFRFTGSEIYKDVGNCISYLDQFLYPFVESTIPRIDRANYRFLWGGK